MPICWLRNTSSIVIPLLFLLKFDLNLFLSRAKINFLILNQLLLLTCGNLYDFWRITSSFNSFEWTYNCREHIAWFAISQFVCLQRTVILTRSLIRLDLPKFLHIARTVTKFYLHLLWIRECEFYFWTNVKVLKFTTKHVESAIFHL